MQYNCLYEDFCFSQNLGAFESLFQHSHIRALLNFSKQEGLCPKSKGAWVCAYDSYQQIDTHHDWSDACLINSPLQYCNQTALHAQSFPSERWILWTHKHPQDAQELPSCIIWLETGKSTLLITDIVSRWVSATVIGISLDHWLLTYPCN